MSGTADSASSIEGMELGQHAKKVGSSAKSATAKSATEIEAAPASDAAPVASREGNGGDETTEVAPENPREVLKVQYEGSEDKAKFLIELLEDVLGKELAKDPEQMEALIDAVNASEQ